MKQLLLILTILFALASCKTTGPDTSLSNVNQDNSQEMKFDHKAKVRSFISVVNATDTATGKSLVNPEYIQHNPFIPTGRASFINLFPVLQKYGTQAETQRMLHDGNYVVMHNHWKNADPFGANQMASFDVLRFDENGLIIEHWDALMPMGTANVSGRTLLDGPKEVTDFDQTEANKAKVAALFAILEKGNPEEIVTALPKYFTPDYHQHNPNAGDGIEGFAKAVQSGDLNFSITKQHKVLGEGNFVVSISEGIHNGSPAVFYDLLRLEEGMIVEHWDIIQDIPTENLANSNTMFGFSS